MEGLGVFVHIPRTAGTSMTKARGIKKPKLRRKLMERYGPIITFGHRMLANLQMPEGSFTFSFCRNPYDRAVSMWALSQASKNQPRMTFAEFCRNLNNWTWGHRIRIPQSDWLDGGELDFLGRFENLAGDFGILCDKLGFKRIELPHENKSERGPWQDYSDRETRDIIREFYAQDFERFGYEVD